MGWLGWTEQQVLSADVNAILIAQAGRVELLNAVFGSGQGDGSVDPTRLPEFGPGMMGH